MRYMKAKDQKSATNHHHWLPELKFHLIAKVRRGTKRRVDQRRGAKERTYSMPQC